MKFIRLVIIFIISLLFVCNAYSENWILIDTQPNGDNTYIDPSTIKYNDGYRTAWTHVNVAKPKKSMKNMKNAKVKYKVFCGKNKYTIEYIAAYDAKGGVIHSGYTRDINEAVPGSIGEVIYNFVCNE